MWEVLKTRDFDEGICTASRVFCQVHGDKKRSLIKFLSRFYSQQSFHGQRVVATALLGEFVNHCADDSLLLKVRH